MALGDDVGKQFDYQRQKAATREAANLQGQKDAMARRAAQLGGGPSGAFIKQEQIAGDQSAARLADANAGINEAQNAEVRRLNEVKEGRDFQTSERLGSQGFATKERLGSQEFGAGQADLGRKFQTSERLGSEDFGAGQAAIGRKFQTSERLGTQKFASKEATEGRDWQGGQNDLNRSMQKDQFGKTLDFQKDRALHEDVVDQFNMELATKMANKKDMLEQLFGNFTSESIGGMFGSGGAKVLASGRNLGSTAARGGTVALAKNYHF